MTHQASFHSPQGVQAAMKQQRATGMAALPMQPHIENAPPDNPKRTRGPSKTSRRKAVKSQPRDKAGRFAEKPDVFTRAFDGIERAQKTVRSVQRAAKRTRGKPAGYTKRRRRVRRAVVAPQPNYRQSTRKGLWSKFTGLFRGKRV